MVESGCGICKMGLAKPAPDADCSAVGCSVPGAGIVQFPERIRKIRREVYGFAADRTEPGDVGRYFVWLHFVVSPLFIG